MTRVGWWWIWAFVLEGNRKFLSRMGTGMGEYKTQPLSLKGNWCRDRDWVGVESRDGEWEGGRRGSGRGVKDGNETGAERLFRGGDGDRDEEFRTDTGAGDDAGAGN